MAQLTLQSLIESSAFAGLPVKREIRYHGTDGQEATADVWVRRGSYQTVTTTWKDAAEDQEHLAARIAAMICDKDGNPVLSKADVLGTADPARGPICETLFLALITAVNEVQAEKTTPQKTSGSK